MLLNGQMVCYFFFNKGFSVLFSFPKEFNVHRRCPHISVLFSFPEFIEVGKPIRALDALAEVIKSKKYRSTTYSEKVLEPIMIKYLELCVDLKKAYMAKEGLFQYRNMCQSVSINLRKRNLNEF